MSEHKLKIRKKEILVEFPDLDLSNRKIEKISEIQGLNNLTFLKKLDLSEMKLSNISRWVIEFDLNM